MAGRKIRALLDRTDPPTTVDQFARDAGLNRMIVHRILNGDRWRRIDVNVVLAIVAAAKEYGLRLEAQDFAAITAVAVDDDQDEAPAARRATGTSG